MPREYHAQILGFANLFSHSCLTLMMKRTLRYFFTRSESSRDTSPYDLRRPSLGFLLWGELSTSDGYGDVVAS